MWLQFLLGKESGDLEQGKSKFFLCFEAKRNLLIDLGNKEKNGNFKITFKKKSRLVLYMDSLLYGHCLTLRQHLSKTRIL